MKPGEEAYIYVGQNKTRTKVLIHSIHEYHELKNGKVIHDKIYHLTTSRTQYQRRENQIFKNER